MTRAEIEKDEQILAAILAVAGSGERQVYPNCSHDGLVGSGNGFGMRSHELDGPCCAVGAGVVFAGVKFNNSGESALSKFAELHGVTYNYAIGVSDGFEYPLDLEPGCSQSADYMRGFDVGRAAFVALYGEVEP